MTSRPRLLIIAEFERDGQQYALKLGLPSRHAFEVVTNGRQLLGRNDEMVRRCPVGCGSVELDTYVRRMISSGRLREATDEDVAAIIAAWQNEAQQ